MDNKRLILAAALFLVFMVGYRVVMNNFFPPAPKQPVPVQLSETVANKIQRDVGTWLGAAPAPALPMPNLDDVQLVLDADKRLTEKKKAEAIAAQQVAVPDHDVVLGDEGYKILVTLSERGAAVRKITLTGFKAATRLEARPLDEPLMLLNDDEDGDLAGLPLDKKLERQSFRLLVEGVTIDWKLREKAVDKAVFEADLETKGVRVIKTFTLKPGEYHLGLEIRLEALPGTAKTDLVYELTGPRGISVEGLYWKTGPYRQVVYGMMQGKNGQDFTREMRDPQVINPAGINKPNPPSFVDGNDPRDLQFAGVMTQYFAAAIVVNGEPAQRRYVEKITPVYLGDDPDYPPGASKIQGRVSIDVSSRPARIETGKAVQHEYLLYTGPAKIALLGYEKGIDPSLVTFYGEKLHLATFTDYHWDNAISRVFWRVGITRLFIFFTNLMHWLLESLHSVVHNYGIAIILMTLIVRGLMFPISRKQAVMGQRQQQKMAAVKPELDKIKEKYKNEPQELQRAQMDLYRKHGLLNPLNSGCLVVFLQMPIFMGLYYALYESVHLRLASFLWIQNLAAPDMLVRWGNWGNFAVPFLGGMQIRGPGPYFNILPIVSATLMGVVQKMMTPPALDEQQAMQQKMMTYMTALMGYLFYWVPAGLCIYFIISSTWGALERKLLPKKTAAAATPTPGKPTATPAKTARARQSKNGATDGMWGKLKDQWQQLLDQAKKK